MEHGSIIKTKNKDNSYTVLPMELCSKLCTWNNLVDRRK